MDRVHFSGLNGEHNHCSDKRTFSGFDGSWSGVASKWLRAFCGFEGRAPKRGPRVLPSGRGPIATGSGPPTVSTTTVNTKVVYLLLSPAYLVSEVLYIILYVYCRGEFR